eukprot:Unigene8936_Nuclearia_a/m.27359 Unigene8936_Nuclearia_a/g.27359  ORF Unigene8936_Nuclearia_a/g.27359 Unigene8936_Nuclearia_a/m.27359 type:complete len:448 (-) Unigene8936_Nuclearia_a:621-1964(-)
MRERRREQRENDLLHNLRHSVLHRLVHGLGQRVDQAQRKHLAGADACDTRAHGRLFLVLRLDERLLLLGQLALRVLGALGGELLAHLLLPQLVLERVRVVAPATARRHRQRRGRLPLGQHVHKQLALLGAIDAEVGVAHGLVLDSRERVERELDGAADDLGRRELGGGAQRGQLGRVRRRDLRQELRQVLRYKVLPAWQRLDCGRPNRSSDERVVCRDKRGQKARLELRGVNVLVAVQHRREECGIVALVGHGLVLGRLRLHLRHDVVQRLGERCGVLEMGGEQLGCERANEPATLPRAEACRKDQCRHQLLERLCNDRRAGQFAQHGLKHAREHDSVVGAELHVNLVLVHERRGPELRVPEALLGEVLLGSRVCPAQAQQGEQLGEALRRTEHGRLRGLLGRLNQRLHKHLALCEDGGGQFERDQQREQSPRVHLVRLEPGIDEGR